MILFDASHVTPVDPALLHRRNDPNDPRLGEAVLRGQPAYAGAQVVLLGSPQDEGVRRNQGRPGAAAAPAEIRRALYRLSTNGIESERLLDLGDVVPQKTLEETHGLQRRLVQQLLADGKRVIVLGGGNDIAYPDCAALAATAKDLLAFNIDRHFDVRADPVRNSGTPYRQLIDENLLRPQSYYAIGVQPFANSAYYAEWLRQRGANTVSLAALRELGITQTFRRVLRARKADGLFWGFDLDVVCAADAPGVSAPAPTGLSAAELCQIATIAGSDARTRVVEFSEMNPTFDVDGATARLVAVAIYHYLAARAHPQE